VPLNNGSYKLCSCAKHVSWTQHLLLSYCFSKKKNLCCLNCFARGHQLRDCESTHTPLHRSKFYPAPSNPSPRLRPRPNTSVATATVSTDSTVQNYFATGYIKYPIAPDSKLCSFTIRSPMRPTLQINTTAYVLQQLAGNFVRIRNSFYGIFPNCR